MKTATLRLAEYKTGRIRLSRSTALRLHKTGHVTVTPDPQDGWWQVTAHHYVGSMVIEDLRIHIDPKIGIENLFLLLGVGLREQDWRRAAAQFALDDDLLPAVVSFFTRSVDLTLRRGIHRFYQTEQDRLQTIRGRIDIPKQMTRAGVLHPVDCRFDEYTADIAENRYLKTALRKALRLFGVLPQDRRRLHRLLSTLEEVDNGAVRPELLDRIVFNRLNAHYEPALHLARLLLKNLTLKDDPGETQASSFMVDMNHLFERFVTDRLRRALRGTLDVKPQHSAYFDVEQQIGMAPDLLFRRGGAAVFVADLKYKLVQTPQSPPTSDYYQLLAYLTALDLSEGALIYCRDPETTATDFGPRSITVRQAEKTIHVYGLDISGSTAQVDREIDQLADWISSRTTRRLRLAAVS